MSKLLMVTASVDLPCWPLFFYNHLPKLAGLDEQLGNKKAAMMLSQSHAPWLFFNLTSRHFSGENLVKPATPPLRLDVHIRSCLQQGLLPSNPLLFLKKLGDVQKFSLGKGRNDSHDLKRRLNIWHQISWLQVPQVWWVCPYGTGKGFSMLVGQEQDPFIMAYIYLPCWELTYPLPRHFWKWFSFLPGGMCWFPGGYKSKYKYKYRYRYRKKKYICMGSISSLV